MYAADSGKCDIVTELISLGADVDIQDNVSHFLMTLSTGLSTCVTVYTAATYFTYGILSLWDILTDRVSSLGKHI